MLACTSLLLIIREIKCLIVGNFAYMVSICRLSDTRHIEHYDPKSSSVGITTGCVLTEELVEAQPYNEFNGRKYKQGASHHEGVFYVVFTWYNDCVTCGGMGGREYVFTGVCACVH